MISYYLFMALLCVTLILWAIIAIRDDGPTESPDEANDEASSNKLDEHR